MAFKLTRTELSNRDEIIEGLRTKKEKFEESQKAPKEPDPEFTDEARQLNMEASIAEYIVVLDDARTLRDDLVDRFNNEFDEKSERWQESDKASDVRSFIDEWENADFEDPDLDNLLELELEEHDETLQSLPEETE